MTILQNVILGISLAAPIGPCNIAIIKKGLNKGFWQAIMVGIGVVAADTLFLLLIYFGLSRFLNIPIFQIIIFVMGASILMYMGYKSVKEYLHGIKLITTPSQKKDAFMEGFLINISNPFTIIWWSGVFGATLTEALHTGVQKTQALINSLTVVIGILIWVLTVSLLTHWGKRFVNKKTLGYISLIAGLILIGFGIKLGYSAAFLIINI